MVFESTRCELQSWPKMYRTACRTDIFLFKFDLILNSPPAPPIQCCFLPIPSACHRVIIPHAKSIKSKYSNSNIEWGERGRPKHACTENDSSIVPKFLAKIVAFAMSGKEALYIAVSMAATLKIIDIHVYNAFYRKDATKMPLNYFIKKDFNTFCFLSFSRCGLQFCIKFFLVFVYGVE